MSRASAALAAKAVISDLALTRSRAQVECCAQQPS